MKNISVDTVVTEIGNNLMQVRQWSVAGNTSVRIGSVSTGNLALAHQYGVKAEVLIELLEVDECGSIGGFAPGQKVRSLLGRFIWQYQRLDNPSFPEGNINKLVEAFNCEGSKEMISN